MSSPANKMLAIKRWAVVALEVNLRKCLSHAFPRQAPIFKAAYSGFETQRKYHKKSKASMTSWNDVY